jgi:hypothetical protein
MDAHSLIFPEHGLLALLQDVHDLNDSCKQHIQLVELMLFQDELEEGFTHI